jgi:hypothetical protein
MTPKEKAIELVDIYEDRCPEFIKKNTAKWCALIAVDEILRSHHNLYGVNSKQVKFYSEVQQEIELL